MQPLARRLAVRLALAPLTLASACEREPARAAAPATPTQSQASVAPSAAAQTVAMAVPQSAAPAQPATTRQISPPVAGTEVAIPASRLRLGSPTGSAQRNPAREADDVEVAVAAFAIDALPYPNDPGEPPKSGVSREEAARLCAAEGKRLCSEIEWELACKGAAHREYPTQAKSFETARCGEKPTQCASDFGVFALGTSGREWTQSPAGRADWDRMRTASVRGAPKDAPATLHRCAARDAAAPESRSDSLLFRCCRGPAPREVYPEQPDAAPFADLSLKPEVLRSVLSAMPETSALAADFRLHAAGELTQALTKAGRSLQALAPWQVAPASLAWSPLRGESLVLLSGDTRAGATLIAYYPDVAGKPRFAGRYTTKDEHVPLLVAYKPDQRDELLFSTCWGCGGEGGALRLDASGRLRFLPR